MVGEAWATRASATVVKVSVLPVPAVEVEVGRFVGELVGVNVVVGVNEGEAVTDGVLLTIGVSVLVDVFVNVGVDVDVAVSLAVGTFVVVTVAVDVNVAVAVSPLWVVITSCGGVVPSREEKVTPSLLSATNANV